MTFSPDIRPRASRPRPTGRISALLLWLMIATSLPELVLTAADWGLVGSARWRALAYQNGAFWVGLLRDWRPNYAAQPGAMFFSYAFLHGGIPHLLGNMLALFVFGTLVIRRAGSGGFLAVYAAAAVGGGLAFGLISTSPQPMVGASGALFGLAGALVLWDAQDRRRARLSLRPVFQAVLGYMVLNLVLWAALAGQLAWETHLGGFLAGAAVAALLRRPGQ
ncbi:MAG TPA: rhomboid family intramembrane serine protease, partial [Paracoccaceae bacterium]